MPRLHSRFRANDSLLNRLFLLVAGAAAGVTGGLLVREPFPLISAIIAGATFLAFCSLGFAIPAALYDALTLWRRDSRCGRSISIGVLADLGTETIDISNSSWAPTTPKQWLGLATKVTTRHPKVHATFVKSDAYLLRYHWVLNPYGGVIPEENTATRPTFKALMDYVAGGGAFANIGDLPTYWMFDPRLGTKIDATPIVYGAIGAGRPFIETPLVKLLALTPINLENRDRAKWEYAGNDGLGVSNAMAAKFVSERAVVVEKNVYPIVRIKVPESESDVTPFFWIPYGKGGFLICMYWFGRDYIVNEPIPSLVLGVMANRIERCGRLRVAAAT
jgi:hypothetical protein